MALIIDSVRNDKFDITCYEAEISEFRSNEPLVCFKIFSGCNSGHYYLTKIELERLKFAIESQIASFDKWGV